tara:strand:- start:4245 stop:5102 length:858 start_codon:yes stop_codon:yes gene_type:complete
MKEIKILKERLSLLGYDCSINNGNMLVLEDGYAKSFSINNIEILIEDLCYNHNLPLSEIVGLIKDHHYASKKISRGEELGGKKATLDEIFDKMKETGKSKIKEDLRKALLEKKGDSHDYGCAMLYFKVNKEDWDKIQSLIADEDLYEEDGDQSYGREDDPHVTILYGLHADVPDSKIEELVDEIRPTKLTLKKISIFENDKYDVVKFDIVGVSEGKLIDMNAKFVKLPHTTDFPDYHPHSTIAYVKAGTGKKYIQSLSTKDSIVVEAKDVMYSKADGSKNKYKLK